MEKISVLLAEDHTLVRKGLRALLEDHTEIEVIAEADEGRQAVRMVEQTRPDVVLMDFSMPGLNGLEATRQIKQRLPEIKVLVLTRHKNQEYIDRVLEAGASGYIIKKSAPEELVLAIQAVHRGDSYLDPAISQSIINGYLDKPKAEPEDHYHKLTPRQREVLQLIAEGHSTKQIAAMLNISINTVENHRANLMKNLGVHSTTELTQYAIRAGITGLDE